MPRVSGVEPAKEFAHLMEALDRESYERLVLSLVTSEKNDNYFDYFDSRKEEELMYYWGLYHMLRRDINGHFHIARVDRGWEVWERTKKTPPD